MLIRVLTLLIGTLMLTSLPALAIPTNTPDTLTNEQLNGISNHFATVNGIRLHYREIGKGPLVILLHGWPETSFSWRHTMIILANNHYRVVAPDLRGLGQSERTKDGYDKKTIATDIQALIKYLGENQAIVIGHDMGGKVAYVMAYQYPQSVSKLVLVDCMIPGTENGDAFHGGAWHYGFHMAPEVPEMLTQGREKEYIDTLIKTWTFNKDAINEEAIDEYAKHYSTPGGMTAGFNYYRTLKSDAAFVATFQGKKLAMPVLIITGRHGVNDKLQTALQSQTTSLQSFIIEDSGHFVAEEVPETFNTLVINFLKTRHYPPNGQFKNS